MILCKPIFDFIKATKCRMHFRGRADRLALKVHGGVITVHSIKSFALSLEILLIDLMSLGDILRLIIYLDCC